MKVKVIVHFAERGVVGRPGEIIDVPWEMAERLIREGMAKPIESRKRKGPTEDKALRPSEDKSEGASG